MFSNVSWSVLVIEDDDDIRESLATVLDARGFRVLAARHGLDAIEQVRARAARPAVIVLDLMMPAVDGEAFLALQAQEPLLEAVPVVVLTGNKDRLPRPVPAIVRRVLEKPMPLATLLDTIRDVCNEPTPPRRPVD